MSGYFKRSAGVSNGGPRSASEGASTGKMVSSVSFNDVTLGQSPMP
jgi:hypothetical protein